MIEIQYAEEEFNLQNRICIDAIINKEHYEICEEHALIWWSNDKKGPWGRSIIGTKDDRSLASRAGLLGEVGLGYGILNQHVKFCRKQYGFKDDFTITTKRGTSYTVDVKTSTIAMPEVALVRGEFRGDKLNLADLFVFAKMFFDNRENKETMIRYIGYMLGSKIKERYTLVDGKTDEHRNFAIPNEELNPMEEFVENIVIPENKLELPTDWRKNLKCPA